MRRSDLREIAERKAFKFYFWYDKFLETLDVKTQQAFLVSLFMYAMKGETYDFGNSDIQGMFEKAIKQIDDDREKAIKKLAEREERKCNDRMTKTAM